MSTLVNAGDVTLWRQTLVVIGRLRQSLLHFLHQCQLPAAGEQTVTNTTTIWQTETQTHSLTVSLSLSLSLSLCVCMYVSVCVCAACRLSTQHRVYTRPSGLVANNSKRQSITWQHWWQFDRGVMIVLPRGECFWSSASFVANSATFRAIWPWWPVDLDFQYAISY